MNEGLYFSLSIAVHALQGTVHNPKAIDREVPLLKELNALSGQLLAEVDPKAAAAAQQITNGQVNNLNGVIVDLKMQLSAKDAECRELRAIVDALQQYL